MPDEQLDPQVPGAGPEPLPAVDELRDAYLGIELSMQKTRFVTDMLANSINELNESLVSFFSVLRRQMNEATAEDGISQEAPDASQSPDPTSL